MTGLDYSLIAAYFLLVIGLGFFYQRRASADLDAYFLGNRSLSWLGLAMSGSVSNFDITGTMWICSILFVLGMRSMWHHWMWGWLMGAFYLAYMGKWVRRSGVMTGAEWMLTRFGAGPGGAAARMAAAVMAVVTMSGMIGYAFQGISKFAHVYFPAWPPQILGLAIIGVTTLYVLLGGLYSVVVTDIVQTVLVTLGSIVIAVIAYAQLTPEGLAEALPVGWTSLKPVWRLPQFHGDAANAQFEFFGVLVICWVLKGLLTNAGGPGGMYEFQRFLAARTPRDAAKVGAAWSLFMIVRWAMAMGITLLGIVAIREVSDPEQVMPIVLDRYLPPGLKGLVMAGLLAAFMSTFSSTVNSGASYVIRDFYQPYINPGASQRHLVFASQIATVGVVLAGLAIGFQADSIAQIWQWLMMALTSGVLLPNVVRWYWWRLNGWGYAAGAFGGMILALAVHARPMPEAFAIVTLGSFAALIAGTYLTPPTPENTLAAFYAKVQPFGLWGPVRRTLGPQSQQPRPPSESPFLALLNVSLGMAAITGLYLAPMYLIGHWHAHALVWTGIAAAALAALALTWRPHLPDPEEE